MRNRSTLCSREATELIETADALADAAGAAILPWFRAAGLISETKSDQRFDPVTQADHSAEHAMRAILAQRRPQDAIRGEEFGQSEGTSGLTWVLDPVDGTRAFLCGAPTWGVLIAVCDADGPRHGIIDQPFTRERWRGGLTDPTLRTPFGERSLAMRKTADLSQAILLSTFPEIGTAEEHAAFTRVASDVQLTRYGLDCYGYGLLAAGHVDLVIEAGLNDYDVCGPIAVIEAAGGIVSSWDGGPAHGGGRILAAANAALHDAALRRLAAT